MKHGPAFDGVGVCVWLRLELIVFPAVAGEEERMLSDMYKRFNPGREGVCTDRCLLPLGGKILIGGNGRRISIVCIIPQGFFMLKHLVHRIDRLMP